MSQQVERQRGRWPNYRDDYNAGDPGIKARQSFDAPHYKPEDNPPGGGGREGQGNYGQPRDLEEWETPLSPSKMLYSSDWWLALGPYVGQGPQGWTRSQERIMQDVCERMAQHGHLDARHIQVDVNGDQVILSGSVASHLEKRLAEELAASVWGVHDVNNRLRLGRLGNCERRSGFDHNQ